MKLSFPSLDPIRRDIAADLQALARRPDEEQLTALKLSRRQLAAAHANAHLEEAPVTAAIYRYTGVLFDALSADTLPSAALARLAIGSALFGVVRAEDAIPYYRLSAGSKLPRRDGSGATPTMRARWGNHISRALRDTGEFVIDMRSGAYQQLGPVPEAVTVRVESLLPDGTRKVVSHFNKRYKGELARVLATAPQRITDIDSAAAVARTAGLNVEVRGSQLVVVTAP